MLRAVSEKASQNGSVIYLFIFSSVSILLWRQSYYVNKQTFILDFGLKNYQVLRNQVYFNIPIFLLYYRLYCFLQVLIALLIFLELSVVVPNVRVSFLVSLLLLFGRIVTVTNKVNSKVCCYGWLQVLLQS